MTAVTFTADMSSSSDALESIRAALEIEFYQQPINDRLLYCARIEFARMCCARNINAMLFEVVLDDQALTIKERI